MTHVTIYRGPDGEPMWATITGIDGQSNREELKPIVAGLREGIADGVRVFAFEGDISVEVV